MHNGLQVFGAGAARLVDAARRMYLRAVWGMDIGEGARISLSARLDRANPRGVHIGPETTITFGALILSHELADMRHADTYIGAHCFIGAKAVVAPGVRIGNNCIVSPASVVVKDVPPNSLVAGNPARVVETNIQTGPWGHMVHEENAA